MRGHGGRLSHSRDELVVEMVYLEGGEPQAREARRCARGSHESRQVVAGCAVSVAAEVDTGQHDFRVPLVDAPADLAEDGLGRPAPGCAAHLRDHAEVAREAAAVLHLDERPHALEPDVRLHAADGTDVARDERGSSLAREPNDAYMRGQPGEGLAREVGGTAGHVDGTRASRGSARSLARLAHGFVSHAAGVQNRDVSVVERLAVALSDEPLANLLSVCVRDLAP